MGEKKTNVFLSVCEDSKKFGETNDCTVKSISITTGVPYEKVHAALKKFGRKDRKGASIFQMEMACKELGFEMKIRNKRDFMDKYPASGRKLKNITTNHPKKYNKAWKDGKNYIFSTSGHVAAVVDGVNHDWTVGRYFRVISVFEVVPA